MLALNVLFSLPSVTCHRKIVPVRWWWLPQSFTFLWQLHLIISGIWALLTFRETLIALYVSADYHLLKYLLLGKGHQSMTGESPWCDHKVFCKVETSGIPSQTPTLPQSGSRIKKKNPTCQTLPSWECIFAVYLLGKGINIWHLKESMS